MNRSRERACRTRTNWALFMCRIVAVLSCGLVVNVLVAWVLAQGWTLDALAEMNPSYKLEASAWPVRPPADWPSDLPVHFRQRQKRAWFYAGIVFETNWPEDPESPSRPAEYAMTGVRCGAPLLAMQNIEHAYEWKAGPRPFAFEAAQYNYLSTPIERKHELSSLARGLRTSLMPTRFPNGQAVLPLLPVWPGFAINTVFYAVLLGSVLWVWGWVRRWRRRRRGRCASCGYSRQGLNAAALCPECGANAVPA